MRMLLKLMLVFFASVLLYSCSAKTDNQSTQTKVKIGVVGVSNEVWQPIIERLKAEENINIELIIFSDYIQPNEALRTGDIDLNAYQGYILMDAFNKKYPNSLAAIGETTLNPIGLYSNKYKSVAEFEDKAVIALANDPVNLARGLLLLQSAGLIKLDQSKGSIPDIKDITENRLNLQFKPLVTGQTARALADVNASIINVFMALDAGFIPKRDAIFIEPVDDNSKPYYNIIVARSADVGNPIYQKIVAAYRSDESADIINQRYKGSVIPLWQ